MSDEKATDSKKLLFLFDVDGSYRSRRFRNDTVGSVAHIASDCSVNSPKASQKRKNRDNDVLPHCPSMGFTAQFRFSGTVSARVSGHYLLFGSLLHVLGTLTVRPHHESCLLEASWYELAILFYFTPVGIAHKSKHKHLSTAAFSRNLLLKLISVSN